MNLSDLFGRQKLLYRPDQPAKFPGQILPAIERQCSQVHCLRCGQKSPLSQAALPGGQYYCPSCINLGRVSSLGRFYHLAEPNQFPVLSHPLDWQGQLSAGQAKAAEEVRLSMGRHDHRLLWAVTGAGKTEMIFPAINQALKRQERVGIASPRVDVCLELYPRIKRAFPQVPITLLHGRAKEKYHYRQLTISTTHQLLRFYHAFDLLIVDEVDAFPYACNQALLYATKQALKPDGGLLLMTATPGKLLLGKVRRKQLACSYLPLRYHGHLLPEISCRLVGDWRRRVSRQALPAAMKSWLASRLKTGREFLLFVPHVADLKPVAAAIKACLGLKSVATVHAGSADRLQVVQAMRDHRLPFLVTTTILERGVTFPEIDVGVLGADDPIFSSSALVQIAGRVGRSKSRPDGDVSFWIQTYSLAIKEAIQEIKLMNQRGRVLQHAMSALPKKA